MFYDVWDVLDLFSWVVSPLNNFACAEWGGGGNGRCFSSMNSYTLFTIHTKIVHALELVNSVLWLCRILRITVVW